MEGKIFQINEQLSIFIKGKSTKLIMLIGGLGDLLFNIKYFQYLWNKFDENYMICIPNMRSSGNSFGSFTIWNDVEDINEILSYIYNKNKLDEIYLLGHSTGCQDILCLFKKGINKQFPIKKCILQGPVSDRDYLNKDEKLFNEIKRIEKEYNILYENWNNSELKNSMDVSKYLYDNKYPLLVRRFVSLYSKLGDEDWFSYDISQETLKSMYSIIDIPFLFVFSLNDQYINYSHDEYKKLIERIENLNDFININIINDNHFIENSFDKFYNIVNNFISK
jgi:pimeloyl-ACP methyl ester carboxylesterase